MKFRKKPIVIEAWHFNGENGIDWPQWLHDYEANSGRVCYWERATIHIPTLEGLMQANIGDWIIKGIQGEVYPCKADIFEATYERVEEDCGPAVMNDLLGPFGSERVK